MPEAHWEARTGWGALPGAAMRSDSGAMEEPQGGQLDEDVASIIRRTTEVSHPAPAWRVRSKREKASFSRGEQSLLPPPAAA